MSFHLIEEATQATQHNRRLAEKTLRPAKAPSQRTLQVNLFGLTCNSDDLLSTSWEKCREATESPRIGSGSTAGFQAKKNLEEYKCIYNFNVPAGPSDVSTGKWPGLSSPCHTNPVASAVLRTPNEPLHLRRLAGGFGALARGRLGTVRHRARRDRRAREVAGLAFTLPGRNKVDELVDAWEG